MSPSYAETVEEMLDLSRDKPDTIAELRRESDALLWELEGFNLQDREHLSFKLRDRVRALCEQVGVKLPRPTRPTRTAEALDLVYQAQEALQLLGRRPPPDPQDEPVDWRSLAPGEEAI